MKLLQARSMAWQLLSGERKKRECEVELLATP
jgi:hypothetical protein